MAIKYRFTRMKPLVDPETQEVIRWVIGLSAWDEDDENLSAYIDAEVPVPQDRRKPQSEWTEDEVRQFAMEYALKEEYTVAEDGTKEYSKQNWFNQLKKQIEAQKGQPIRGTTFVI